MHTRILACTLALLLTAFLQGQDEAKKSRRGDKKQSATIEGCLTGPNDQNVYVLANEDKCCILLEGEPDMSKHVGHKVKLTGQWTDPEDIRGRENIAGKKVREGKKVKDEPEPEQRFFKVSQVEHVADTCTLPEAKD